MANKLLHVYQYQDGEPSHTVDAMLCRDADLCNRYIIYATIGHTDRVPSIGRFADIDSAVAWFDDIVGGILNVIEGRAA